LTAQWEIDQGDGFNVYTAVLQAGVDDDTDILFINPTFRDLSIFIINPAKEALEVLGSNIIKEKLVAADLVPLVPTVRSLSYETGFVTSITAISILSGAIVSQDTKVSILERLR
jgi:hypothetical protein